MKSVCIALVRWYQLLLSPLFPPSCRFFPTCSNYAIEALSLYSVPRGLYLIFRRILRCHPFHPGGYDPVPLPAGRRSSPLSVSCEARNNRF